jgi:hypothetical protein
LGIQGTVRSRWGAWWWFLLLACLGGTATAADYRFSDDARRPAPWNYPERDPTPIASDGVRYLGVADRVDLTGKQPAWHRQVGYEVMAERGLASAGQFSISYQPAYHHVVVHAIDVWREGQRLDRRRQSRIEVLRREAGLEAGLLDGGRELSVTIPDVRVGDRIEYRYTIHGYNPVFGRDFHDYWSTRYSAPLGVRLIHIDYPVGMSLTLPDAPEHYAARKGVRDGVQWWQLRGAGLPALDEEEGTPASFTDSHEVEISTARGWGDVVQWALPLYPGRFEDRAMAAEWVQRLKLDRGDPAGSLMRATAFVQGEVRYTGLDMGLQSHAPNRPELVIERRFGDCKDKTQLLIALLHEAGVPASPVLVNTRLKATIADRLPSPLAFDHVVVRAELPEGAIWIDPTRDRERGLPAVRAPLGFGLGLRIAPDSTALTDVPAPFPAQPLVDVDQRLDFSGEDGRYKADFLVETTYRPGNAEGVRDSFESEGALGIGKGYLTYMQNFYEGLRDSRPPVLVDGEPDVRVSEAYVIEWNDEADGSGFGIVHFQVLDWVPSLAEQARRTPFSLGGPRYGRQVIRSFNAGGWRIEDGEDIVENAYFHLRRVVEVERDMLRITVEWKRLADEVPAADYARLREDLRKARDLLQYDIDLDAGWTMPSWSLRDWAWPLASLLATAFALTGLWFLRLRWPVAGMLFRPRGTVAAGLAADRLAVGTIVGLVCLVVEAVFERGGALQLKPSALAWGAVVGTMVVLSLRWAFLTALLQFAMRLFGDRVPYRKVFQAYGLALVPILMFTCLAMLAVGFRLHWLDGDFFTDPVRTPAQLAAVLLLVTGLCWWLASLAGACAGVAGTRRRKGALVVGVSVFPLVVVALLAVVFLLPG